MRWSISGQACPRGPSSRSVVLAGVLAWGILSASASPAESFRQARPIWPAGRNTEKNLQVAFRAVVKVSSPGALTLKVTGSTLYRATVNGRYAGYGPARGPHGHYRIDVWDLAGLARGGENIVGIEVAGYNVNSYYTLDQPSFLQAEVLEGEKVLAATGASGFEAEILGERLQKVQRYSFQRPFSEVYRLRADHDRWRTDASGFQPLRCSVDDRPLGYLPRRVPYPEFKVRGEPSVISAGTLSPATPAGLWKDRSLTAIGAQLKGYPEAELEVIPSIEMQKYASKAWPSAPPAKLPTGEAFQLAALQYRILDFGLNSTGFIGARVTAREPTRLVLAFDEVLRDGDVDFKRLGCVNLVCYELPPGTFSLESFEPYTFRYLKPIVLSGKCDIADVTIREYVSSGVEKATFRAADPRLERLFEAGRETFRQNVIDTFMDCPSRERAGWLCDSFFTARVALDLMGEASVEKTQMEDYLLPEKFEFIPDGMLPMCYPADHNDGVFIPNWAMWFVAQLEEYAARSGDEGTANALKGRVLRLTEYLREFENSDGLLEKLPSWVFVEWSAANDYVQDVNYPSNMLYAGVLSATARLYALRDLEAKAERIRETIRRQSFDGTFFVDNAVRKQGKLEVTRNRTEVCQYFAFLFGVATVESHAGLWAALRDKFGPARGRENPFPDVGMANSFIGNMLRIELLSKEGLSQQILDESIDYLLYMAERTGTLWENVGDYASCNHGFASHVVHTLYRDVLGVRELDRVKKKLKIRFAPLKLEWCEGTNPVPGGNVSVSWRKKGKILEYTTSAPEGYVAEIENRSGLELREIK